MSNLIKGVLFDLDNTLMNFLRMKEQAISATVFAIIDSEMDLDYHEAKKEIYGLYTETHMEDPAVFQKFLKLHNCSNPDKIIAKALVAYRKAKSANMLPYPGVKLTLFKLKAMGIKLGIVSDAPRINAWKRLVELGLEDFFDVVITYDDVGVHKPAKLPFDRAQASLGLNINEILFVGDNPLRDVKGANNFGFVTAFAKYGYFNTMLPISPRSEDIAEIIKKVKPNFVLEKFSDILDILK